MNNSSTSLTTTQSQTIENLGELLSHSNESKGLQSTDIEMKHVFEVYDEIALHWHHTRGKRKVIFYYDFYQSSLCFTNN